MHQSGCVPRRAGSLLHSQLTRRLEEMSGFFQAGRNQQRDIKNLGENLGQGPRSLRGERGAAV